MSQTAQGSEPAPMSSRCCACQAHRVAAERVERIGLADAAGFSFILGLAQGYVSASAGDHAFALCAQHARDFEAMRSHLAEMYVLLGNLADAFKPRDSEVRMAGGAR
jgi:hypothetical protein